eukprot:SAG31_NODE_11135_length_1062_cov_1.230530_1_plen_52_part_10
MNVSLWCYLRSKCVPNVKGIPVAPGRPSWLDGSLRLTLDSQKAAAETLDVLG